MRYDVERLKQDADATLVAEQLGMQTRRVGNRTEALCPSHADTRIGSCVISESCYHCFACGASGDVIKMAQEFLGCGFQEAFRAVAVICGGAERYIGPTGGNADRVITAAECSLIGLRNQPVRREAAYTGDLSGYGSAAYTAELDMSTAEDPEQSYIVYETESRNPLLDLRRSDPASYRGLIRSRCDEALGFYRRMLECLADPGRCRGGYGRAVRAILRDVGADEAMCFARKKIEEVLAVAGKHLGDYTPPGEIAAAVSSAGMGRLVSSANASFLKTASAPF